LVYLPVICFELPAERRIGFAHLLSKFPLTANPSLCHSAPDDLPCGFLTFKGWISTQFHLWNISLQSFLPEYPKAQKFHWIAEHCKAFLSTFSPGKWGCPQHEL